VDLIAVIFGGIQGIAQGREAGLIDSQSVRRQCVLQQRIAEGAIESHDGQDMAILGSHEIGFGLVDSRLGFEQVELGQ